MLKLVVLCTVLAAAAASAPFAPLAYTAPLAYSTALLTPFGSNYRGPLSLAPGQPANILAADGRPLDTLDVNLDRSAHFTAKALNGGLHYLKKRSAPLIAPYSSLAVAAPLAAYAAPLAYAAPVVAPSNYRGPLSLAPGQPANILAADGRPLDTLDVNLDRSAHYTAKALEGGLHYLKKRSAPFAAVTRVAYTSPLIAHSAPLAYSAPVVSHVAPISYAAAPVAHYAGGLHFIKKRSAAFAPITRVAYTAPLIAHSAPLAYSAPLVSHVAPVSYAAAPFAHYTHF
ncbi:cuticle protein 16.5-like [Trichoplusia ni]|nr:cuticle protein 16.5-like [Trichoplusia ni]